MAENSTSNATNEIVLNVNKDVSKTSEDSTSHATASFLQKVLLFVLFVLKTRSNVLFVHNLFCYLILLKVLLCYVC